MNLYSVAVLVALSLAVSSAAVINKSHLQRSKRQTALAVDCEVADIIFVLDSSGSIGIDNWVKVKGFVKSIVEELDIGPVNTRVGAVTYGNRATVNFNLNTFSNKRDVKNAIDNIKWKDQETNTSGGIWRMNQGMFTYDNGDRTRAPNLGIVITDGESNRDKHLVEGYAKEARENGITLLAIGIGDQVKQKELEAIAGNKSLVFNAANFDALSAIRTKVAQAACDIPVECTQNSDIAFVLDASGSVRAENFNKTKDFVKQMIDSINVGERESNMGVITFSDRATLHFGLNKHQTRTDLHAAVNAIPYTYGTTNTAEALRMLKDDMFRPDKGDRPDRPNIAVIFTDGGSNNFKKTIEQAKLVRGEDITIIVVAVSDWVNTAEINEMATDPDTENVFTIKDFNAIKQIANGMQAILCDRFDECDSNPCRNAGTCISDTNAYRCVCPEGYAGRNCEYRCNQKSDIVFAIDSSGSVGTKNYYVMLDFVKNVINSINVDKGLSRVGVVTFADKYELKFHLNQYDNKKHMTSAVSFPYGGGTTNTASAIRYMTEAMFSPSNGDRSDAKNFGFIITDGRSNDKQASYREAMAARAKGIDILIAGVNIRSIYGQRELAGIASDPDQYNVMNVPKFTDLYNLTDQIISAVCNIVNECDSNPCQGGGRCVDKTNGYECMCPAGRTGVNCERNCDGQADIVFLVDASGSIRENRFDLVLNYTRNVISNLEVREDKVRVGMMTFSDSAKVAFQLNSYKTKEDVLHAVTRILWTQGRTHTAEALRILRTEMYTEQNGDRLDVPNYAVIITDGQSNVNDEQTLPEAIKARINGIHLMVVTISDHPNLEIKGIASDPDSHNIMVVQRFSQLPSIIDKLVGAMCDDEDECRSNPCQNGGRCINGMAQYVCMCPDEYTGERCERKCTRRRDVVFILDGSGSVEETFDLAQRLTRRIVHGLNFAGGRTRVGIVTYSDTTQMRFHLNEYNRKESVLNAIAYSLIQGRTNTASGISEMRTNMFTSLHGDRPGDPNYAIVITDGRSNINRGSTLPEAEDAKRAGVTVIAVGIGENGHIDRAELNGMASDPESEHMFIMKDASEMDKAADMVLDTICQ